MSGGLLTERIALSLFACTRDIGKKPTGLGAEVQGESAVSDVRIRLRADVLREK